MRQVMPHRNNIHLRRINCKIFLSVHRRMRACATFLPQGDSRRFPLRSSFAKQNNHLRDTPWFRDCPSIKFRHG